MKIKEFTVGEQDEFGYYPLAMIDEQGETHILEAYEHKSDAEAYCELLWLWHGEHVTPREFVYLVRDVERIKRIKRQDRSL